MNKTGIISIIIATFISVVMIASVLVPVLDQETELHYTNNYGTVAKECDGATLAWTWDGSASGGAYSWTVDGVEQTNFVYELVSSTPILMSDNFTMSINASNGIISNGASFNYGADGVRSVAHGLRSATITLSGSTATLVLDSGSGAVTKTLPYSWVYCAVDDGDYRLVNGSRAPGKYYYDSLEDIKGNGNAGNVWFTFAGDSGMVGPNAATVAVEPVSVGQNLEYISYGYVSNVWTSTLNLEYGGTTYTPAYFAMPYQVDGHQDGITDSVSDLLNIVPLLLIVAVIAGIAIRMINVRN